MPRSRLARSPRSLPAGPVRALLLGTLGLAGAGAQAATTLLAPDSLRVVGGSVSDQGIGVLAEASLSGTADGWSDYIELSPAPGGFVADFTFELPTDLLERSIDAFEVETNHKGSAHAVQPWNWSIRDDGTGLWEPIGDNRDAASWVWTRQSFAVPGIAADHIDALGRVQLRLHSPSSGDDANLDYLALRVVDSAAPASASASAVPASSTSGAGGASVGTDGIWRPSPGTSWQIQFTGTIDTSLDVEVYDLDLYDTPKDRIDALHAAGRKVICYFSAGSWENWRPDAGRFPESVLGANMANWPGERWLDIRQLDALAPIMEARLDLAAAKGCDAVEPDNVEGYANATGRSITAADQLAYNRYLAGAAHARGLSIGLKNDLDQVAELEPHFDWAINESCNVYDECERLKPFVDAGKAVFGVEYTGDPATFCSRTNALDFDFLKKRRSLDAAREACR